MRRSRFSDQQIVAIVREADSGTIAQGRALAPSFQGPTWLAGDSAGPEASALTLTLLVGAIWLIVSRQRGAPATMSRLQHWQRGHRIDVSLHA